MSGSVLGVSVLDSAVLRLAPDASLWKIVTVIVRGLAGVFHVPMHKIT